MQLILHGQILSPIVTKRAEFHLEGCKFTIKKPRRRYFTKIIGDKPMYPYSMVCYLGMVEVRYKCRTRIQAKRKLAKLLEIGLIGRFHTEGLGQVKWLRGEIKDDPSRPEPVRKYSNVRIRKGLPHDLPKEILKLLHYALLHDFAHTEKHGSKIYVEPNVPNLDYLRQHHTKTKDPLIQTFQKYDRLAALITRKVQSPRNTRYNWASNGTLDFEQLAKEIEGVTNQSVWKLYQYIYESKALAQLNESLEYGHTSLRSHLLLIANLIVRDYQRNRL
ncbi:MAG: hypothetical protein ACFFBD_20545 [Candidatus Hodarchaeota archaeon]